MQCKEQSPTSTRDTKDATTDIDLSGENDSVEQQYPSTISNTDDANDLFGENDSVEQQYPSTINNTDDANGLSGQNNFESSNTSNKDDENMANDGNFDLQKDLERLEVQLPELLENTNKKLVVNNETSAETRKLFSEMKQHYESQIEGLTREYENQIQCLQSKIQDMSDENKILEKSIYENAKVRKRLHESNETFAKKSNDKKCEIRIKNLEIHDLKLDLTRQSERFQNKCTQNDRLAEQKNVISKKLETQTRQLKKEKSDLTEKNKQQTREIQARDKKIGELLSTEKKTCDSLKEATKEKNKHLQTNLQLNSEIRKVLHLMQTANNKLQEYQEEIKHLKEENEEHDRKLRDAKIEFYLKRLSDNSYYLTALSVIIILFIIFNPYFILLLSNLYYFIVYLFRI